MLTPAEELGLSGLSLTSRVRRAFHALPESQLAELLTAIRTECSRRHVVYLREGRAEPVHLMPVPVTLLPDQLAYLQYSCWAIHNALKRLPDLYFADHGAREVLRITDEEEAWLRECWSTSHRESNPIFGRLDAVADFTSPMWKDSLQFVEPNMSGIGGLHLAPTGEQIVHDLVVPALQGRDPELRLERGHDMRELLMQELLDHLELIGRPGRRVCFVEPRFAGSGIDEQDDLARFYLARHGLRVLHADPSELEVHGGEVRFEGEPIDLAYRDYTVLDLLALRESGGDIEPMRRLFRENRVVSSIAAELDQKACFEILTDPRFHQAFTADERQLFRRHIPWTRIVSDRSTELPDGGRGDLLEFVRRERESLVLKPNRGYGGEGVLLGLAAGPSDWARAIDAALADENRWVVQRLVVLPVGEFPLMDAAGAIHMEPFHVVFGFAPSKYGVAILTRVSQKQVVNVAQRGGIAAVAIGHHAARLRGPMSGT